MQIITKKRNTLTFAAMIGLCAVYRSGYAEVRLVEGFKEVEMLFSVPIIYIQFVFHAVCLIPAYSILRYKAKESAPG